MLASLKIMSAQPKRCSLPMEKTTFTQKAAKGIAVFARKLTLGMLIGLALITTTSHSTDQIERVDYRLADWKSLHFKDAKQAASYVKTFKAIGVDHKQESHGDHIDVTFRCPKWRTLRLKTHKDAHQWEGFLKKIGFETKHDH